MRIISLYSISAAELEEDLSSMRVLCNLCSGATLLYTVLGHGSGGAGRVVRHFVRTSYRGDSTAAAATASFVATCATAALTNVSGHIGLKIF